jgi:hypothetical protein
MALTTAEGAQKKLAERILSLEDFKKPGYWQTFTLYFKVQLEQIARVEYRAEYLGGASAKGKTATYRKDISCCFYSGAGDGI